MRRAVMTSRVLLIAAIVVLLSALTFLGVLFMRIQAPTLDLSPTPGGMEWVRSLYGFGPSADEQFRRPYSVAVGPGGRIYATDPGRSRIMVFSPYGRFERLVHTGAGGVGEGEFAQPEAIDLDRSGNLYIAESRARKIIIFDAEGRFVREWGVDYQPRGIAVSAGSIYVLGEGTVYVYTSSGAETLRFATRGSEPGQIDAYLGIEVDRGTIYVADSYNRRIQAFDRTGELLWARPERALPRSVEMTSSVESTGGLSADDTPFAWDLPQDIAVDGAGRLVVIDAFRYEIVVLDPGSGEVVDTYGGYGRADGLFNRPTSIDYDSERDWFVIADTDNSRVQIVRLPGSGATPLAGIRRIADSPARWLAPTMILLIIVLIVSAVQWRRTAAGNRSSDAARASRAEEESPS